MIFILVVIFLVTFLFPVVGSAYEIDEIVEQVNVEFELGFEQEREKVLDIPGIRRVENISVNTGVVEYEVAANKLIVRVKDGEAIDTAQDSKVVSTTRKSQSVSNLPQFVEYDENGYVGTLYKKGNPYQVVISGSPAGSKTVIQDRIWTENVYYRARSVKTSSGDTIWIWDYAYTQSSGDPGTVISYSDGEYSGTLNSTHGTSKICTNVQMYSFPSQPSEGQIVLGVVYTYKRIYSGTVSKPDTRVYGYEQVYEGTVIGPDKPRYMYSVTATIVKAKVKTMTYKFSRSTSRTRQTTLTIPKLSGIVSVQVDTGRVDYQRVDGDKIEITVSNGSAVDSYIPSKDVTYIDSYTSTSSTPSFSNSYYYNDGYYSGYIYKSGSPWSSSFVETKFVSYYWGSIYKKDIYRWTGSSWVYSHTEPYTGPYSEYYSDSDGYSGWLNRVNTGTSSVTYYSMPSDPYVGQTAPYCGYYAYYYMQGTVSRTAYTHYQTYSGTVYGPTIYYYEYNVIIEYVDDAPAPPGPFVNPTASNKEKGNNTLNVVWNHTEDWGPGTAETRRYELQFYDGSNWGETYVLSGVNPSNEYDFLLPYLNTNKAKFRVRAVTNLGESPWVYSDDFIVDSNPPTVTASKTSGDQNYTTGKITLTYSDNLSGVKVKEYAWHTSNKYLPDQWIPYTTSVEQTNLGTWYLWYRAEDNAGNEVVGCFGPYTVLFPSVVSITATPSSRNWVNTDIPIRVTVSINGLLHSGMPLTLQRVYYGFSSSNIDNDSWDILNGDEAVLSDEGVWYLHVRAILRDDLGEYELVRVFGQYKLDKTPSCIEFNPYSHDWTNGNINVTLTVREDLSGFREFYYRTSSNNGQTWSSWYRVTSNTRLFTFSSTGEHLIEAYAVDIAGNQSDVYASGVYKVDKTLPSVTFSPNGSSTWLKDANSLVIVQDGHSGVDENSLEYAWSTSTYTPSSGWTKFNNGDIIYIPEGITGRYYLHVRARDIAGNIINARSNQFSVDNTPPSVPSISVSNQNWTNQKVNITIYHGTDAHSGVDRTEYRINGGEWKTYSSVIVLSDEGLHTIEARTIDRAGNISNIVSKEVKIDKTPPNVPIITVDPSGWTNQIVTVTITPGEDNLSGVNSIQYRINGGSWKTYLSPFTLSNQGIYTIEARQRDNAGNYSEIANAEAKIDKTIPTITANPTSKDWVNTDITVTLTYNDTGGSGLKDRLFKWSQSTMTPSDWDNYETAATQVDTGIWYLHARAIDNAGNIYTTYFGPYRIDKIPPNISTLVLDAASPTSIVVYVSAEDPQPGIGLHSKAYRYYRDGNLILDWTNYSSYIDQGLRPNTRYNYSVQGRDALGNTSNLVGTFKYTLANIPMNLRVSFDGGLIVQWDPNDNPDYTKYEIKYTDMTDGTENSIVIDDAQYDIENDTITYVIENVFVDRAYKVSIRAINEEGIPTEWVEHEPVNTYNVKGFIITNIRDIRWKDYGGFPISDGFPVIERDGLMIGLGYGMDFEIITEGFGELGDLIEIDVSFVDEGNRSNQLDLRINGSSLPAEYTKIVLTDSDRIDKGAGLYKWKGYYFLPFTVAQDSDLPEYILVKFDIKAIKQSGEVVKYDEVSEVIAFTTSRTAYDDLFLNRFR